MKSTIPLNSERAQGDTSAPPKLALSIKEFCETAAIGQTKVYSLIGEGKLRTRKVGRHRIILVSDALALLESLPTK